MDAWWWQRAGCWSIRYTVRQDLRSERKSSAVGEESGACARFTPGLIRGVNRKKAEIIVLIDSPDETLNSKEFKAGLLNLRRWPPWPVQRASRWSTPLEN